jgi:hypothetical protein
MLDYAVKITQRPAACGLEDIECLHQHGFRTRISGTSPKSLRCITTRIASPLPLAGCRILSTMGSPAEGTCAEEMTQQRSDAATWRCKHLTSSLSPCLRVPASLACVDWHRVAPPWDLHGVYPSATIRQDHRRRSERGYALVPRSC